MAGGDLVDPNQTLRPLGAGDLIDRAVRFYRNNFWTFIFIAAPPVVAGTVISVAWTVAGRSIFSSSAKQFSTEHGLYLVFLWFGTIAIWLTETVATLVVMGGASRNFVRHLLFGEPITFKETYRNTLKRLAGLVVASTIITFVLGAISFVVFYFAFAIAAVVIVLVVAVLSWVPVLAFVAGLAVGIAATWGALWLFFLVASRFAYIPQVMLVEGQGVFASIGRSASLAGGSVRRLTALFVFTTVAAYSALALLYVPLVWYAKASGVELMTFDMDTIPAWYTIASNVIWQISFILLSPVWMIGLCILYVDERVRTEGYDIELMAARRLGEIPSVPMSYVNPLHPALSNSIEAAPTPRPEGPPSFTTLGLK
jgi:hypothetical protein